MSKAVQLFSLVVQLFKDIDMGTALEKMVHFGTNAIADEFKTKASVPNLWSFFFSCTAFRNIDMGKTEFVQHW